MSVIVIDSYRFAAPFPVWNARDDLAANLGVGKSNPNGRWTYGRKNPSLVFSQLTVSRANGWGTADAFGKPFVDVNPTKLTATPSDNSDLLALRWTAPSAMTVSIDVRASKASASGDGVILYLRTLEVGGPDTAGILLDSSGVLQGPSGVYEYLNPSYVVAAGQHIDFEAFRNAEPSFDAFSIDRLIITQVA